MIIGHGMLQLWIAPRAILLTVDCRTRLATERNACAGGESEKGPGMRINPQVKTRTRIITTKRTAQKEQQDRQVDLGCRSTYA